MSTHKWGLIAAMHEELSSVLDLMSDQAQHHHAGRTFCVGRLHGQEVVVVLCRIGKVAAATTATALITQFGVNCVLFTGVAGGLGTGVAVGDVVVATRFLQHDMDASPLFPRYEVPLYGLSEFSTDSHLSQQLRLACQTALPEVSVHEGLVLSGDRFVATADESRQLQNCLPQALAVEMEGAAIAQVCHDYGVPFGAVRTISDRADDTAHGDFSHFIQTVASRYSAAIVQALLTAVDRPQAG